MHKYIRKPGRKWHIWRTFTRMIGGNASLCDRRFINPEEADDVPEQDICKQCISIERNAHPEEPEAPSAA